MAEPEMPFPDGYSLQQLLTNLAMRVGQMEGTVKTFMDNWARQDQLAHDGRRVMYDRLDLISRQVERIATDVQNVQQDVAELKKEVDDQIMPAIDAQKVRRYQQAGAKSVWAMIGAGVMMIASALAYVADKIASYFIAKP